MTATATLTRDQVAVLAVLAAGATETAAGRALEISPRTLRRRMAGICATLGVGTPIEAVVWAARRGLI